MSGIDKEITDIHKELRTNLHMGLHNQLALSRRLDALQNHYCLSKGIRLGNVVW